MSCAVRESTKLRSTITSSVVMMRAHQNLARLTCPTIAIGSDPTVPYSFVPTMDLSTLAAMNYDFVPDTTHFLQLEKPEACAA